MDDLKAQSEHRISIASIITASTLPRAVEGHAKRRTGHRLEWDITLVSLPFPPLLEQLSALGVKVICGWSSGRRTAMISQRPPPTPLERDPVLTEPTKYPACRQFYFGVAPIAALYVAYGSWVLSAPDLEFGDFGT